VPEKYGIGREIMHVGLGVLASEGVRVCRTPNMATYDASGQNESETYAYSFSQSEKIRQIMAHKDAKLREEEASEHLKNDLNIEILEEADQEEALAGMVTSEATPLSLLQGGSAVPYNMSHSGTAAPSMSVGPVLSASNGRVPTAIVNGQPVFSDSSDPFAGTLRGMSAAPQSQPRTMSIPMSTGSRQASAAPIWPSGMKGSAAPSYGTAAPMYR